MATTKTKPGRSSIAKRELHSAATTMATAGAAAADVGMTYMAEGGATVAAAQELGAAGRTAIAVGASDLTRGVDKVLVADRVAHLSQIASAAGAQDVAEGADLLIQSENIAVMSEIVQLMSREDLDRGLEVARVAGELAAAAAIVERIDMPVLAGFLADRSEWLQAISVDRVLRFTGTRALAQALGATGEHVGDLGVGEVIEGIQRMETGNDLAADSARLAVEGQGQAMAGAVEIGIGQGLSEVAVGAAKHGMAEIAVGAADMGAAAALGTMAEAVEDRAKSR
jgi:hypothetical protein